jgi:uncharacterized membrane protein YfcA
MLLAILVPLVLATMLYAAILTRAALSRGAAPRPEAVALGAVTNFLDTLGIGSFAPSMAWFKFRALVPDRLIPCTMLVGHALPSMAQAIIFLVLLGVLVDPVLLVGCVLALLMGAVLGAPLVTKARVSVVQTVVGCALLLAALLYGMTNLGLLPGGGSSASLPPQLMIAAIAANFIFGILLNFGIGNYAPTLVMLTLMGMSPRLSFPIMAGGAAFAAAGASVRHIQAGHVDLRIAAGLALGGVPAVLVAAFVVKTMPVELLRWLVIMVVLYAGAVMFRASATSRAEERAAKAAQ